MIGQSFLIRLICQFGGFDLLAACGGEILHAEAHEDSFVDAVIRFDQAVHNLGQVCAFDAEFAWAAALAQRKDNCMRAVLVFRAHDGENVVFTLFDILYLFCLVELEIHALQDFVPESDQFFLGEFLFLELSVHGEFHRTRHHQLLARIFRDGAADFAFIHSDVIQLFLDSTQ
jgi:hypothetical protein